LLVAALLLELSESHAVVKTVRNRNAKYAFLFNGLMAGSSSREFQLQNTFLMFIL
jgi:hypothetical protein